MTNPLGDALYMLRSAIATLQNVCTFDPLIGETSREHIRIRSAANAVDWVGVISVALQLILLTLVVRQFEIESTAFFYLMLLTLGGFLIHSALPLRLRLPFFAVLSMFGIALVLGPRLGASVVLIGCVLIAICHLPIGLRLRIALLALAGGVLVAMRTEWLAAPLSPAIWPILGSMFMFRLAIYVYDQSHSKDRPHPAKALSYFFLLPNVCFPLFPVVDYQTFGRTYYNEEPVRIYQRGVHWMFRGITHLIAYRFLYQYVSITPADVANLPDLVRYLVGDFGLILRISGQFHLIVGMLHLFGFNLPPTSHLYFLSSSFTDLWRRMNIYWRDFLQKVFYYPATFRLLRYGPVTAVVLSTIFVFFVTWALHSYQWFWLRGTFPIQWQDGVFWSILGALVIITSVREMRRGRKRSLAAAVPTWSGRARIALSASGTIFTMAVLWSLWLCESFAEWVSMWPAAVRGGITFADGDWQLIAVAGVWTGALSAARLARVTAPVGKLAQTLRNSSPIGTATLILCTYLIGLPLVHESLGASASEVVTTLKSDKLNRRDGVRLERSYYESLMRVDRFNSRLWEVYMKNPVETNEWGEVGRTIRFTDDLRFKELRPSLYTSLKDRTFSTNRWGMRDRDYEQVAPPGTLRIAMVGASVEMGSGVDDAKNFESLVEERLNRDHRGRPHAAYEILNFAVGGYGPVEHIAVVEKQVLAFRPQVLLFAGHDSDEDRAVSLLGRAVVRGAPIPYADLREIAAVAAGAPTEAAAEAKLRPFGREIVAAAYRAVAERCVANGIRPVWMFVPAVHPDRNKIGYLGELARDAGYEVFDLADVYAGRELSGLRVSELDYHPNSEGHRVLAERLYNELREPVFLAAGPTPSAPNTSRR